MPLSEHEERILAQIERQLAEDDPRFVARSRRSVSSPRAWSRSLRLRLAVGLGIVGLICILALVRSVAIAGVGMVLVLTAIVLGGTAIRDQRTPSPTRAPSPDDAL
ncbi:MAG: DUF3040 domain-containing protein [Nitriliruptor sp.]